MSRISLSKLVEANLPQPLIDLSPEQVTKLKDMSAVMLGVIAALGVATIAIAAPNVLKLLKYLPNERYSRGYYSKSKRAKRKITRVIYYLRQQGYVELAPKREDFLMKITQKGRKKLKLINFQSLQLPKSKKWQKTWWFILADIPVEYRSQINSFRKKLKSMGVLTFQKSVWAYPFDPRDELTFLAKYYGLEKYITAVEATKLDTEDEYKLKNHFKSLL